MDGGVEAAVAAGLHYVSNHAQARGVKRKKVGKHFHFYRQDGGKIVDEREVARMRRLAIPPAWRDVWICPDPQGHLQATGRDARGRKQYRYHADWRAHRDETKYHRLTAFARALPNLRKAVDADLRLPGLPKAKVLAAVVRLLEITLIRVGNEEYATQNNSYGLTTLRDEHAQIRGKHVRFHFRGKSGVNHDIDFDDARLAKIVKQCRDLPGQELFQFVDEDGAQHDVGSADVNAYLHEKLGEGFTAKDFRTWAGTVLAAKALHELEAVDSKTQMKKNVVAAIESVAARLGNTKAVCRKCYVHPAVVDAYLDGNLLLRVKKEVEREIANDLPRLTSEETAVLAFLEQRLAREVRDRKKHGDGIARDLKASLRKLKPRTTAKAKKEAPRRRAARRP
jgi:DNA topoisomerase-1